MKLVQNVTQLQQASEQSQPGAKTSEKLNGVRSMLRGPCSLNKLRLSGHDGIGSKLESASRQQESDTRTVARVDSETSGGSSVASVASVSSGVASGVAFGVYFLR